MHKDFDNLRDKSRAAYDRRISIAISLARVVLMCGIVIAHTLLVKDFWAVYAPAGVGFPLGAGSIEAYRATLANQAGSIDKLTFVSMMMFWGIYFAFYSISGFSLWHATRRRGQFDLRDYFFSRFFGIYLGFAAAAVAAFVVTVFVFGHKPGEHDLNFLLLGVARARETMPYNDTLWFLSVLFVLYLVFPVIPVLYRRFGLVGLVGLWALFTWLRLSGQVTQLTYLPTGFSFFLLGIVAADIMYRLRDRLRTRLAWRLLSLAAAATVGLCIFRLRDVGYVAALTGDVFQYDTHAIGVSVFFLLLAMGLLLPGQKGLSKFLRTAGRGTFAVYLYHYLFIQLYRHAPAFHQTVVSAASALPAVVREHLLAGCLVVYAVFLAGGVAYQTAFDRFVSGPLRRIFGQPLELDTKKRRQEAS